MSKPWYRVGPGSGNNPVDKYRSVEGNARVMSRRQFNKMALPSQMATLYQAPTQGDLSAVNNAFGTNFELNNSGGTGYWDMQYLYGGAGATWVPVGQTRGGIRPAKYV